MDRQNKLPYRFSVGAPESSSVDPRWRFFIDRGGTFTDCIGLAPNGRDLRVAKIRSSDEAPLVGIRQILGLSAEAPIPPSVARMGTTVATNALLERKGRPFLLVVPKGLEDALRIGSQARPELFRLEIPPRVELYARVLGVDGRQAPNGQIIEALDPIALRRDLAAARAEGLSSVAVLLLHAYQDGSLEREVGRLAEAAGFRDIFLSHSIAPEIGFVPRGDTTAVDAYVTPILRAYLAKIEANMPESHIRWMSSAGHLMAAERLHGKDALLSGPAGGVVATAYTAHRHNAAPAIGFDMGGTSTDVSRSDGRAPEKTYESAIDGVHVRAPTMHIHTVAAGGGSICRYQGGRLTVGPDSAGAIPGPLCYGHADATELALTDINLFLGRIVPEAFPLPLDRDRVTAALQTIQRSLARDGKKESLTDIAQGFFDIATHRMAQAIGRISVSRGYDVRTHSLVCFGGAAGQHACAIARQLGMSRVLIPAYAGVLSATGMAIADAGWQQRQAITPTPLGPEALARVQVVEAALLEKGRSALAKEPPTDAVPEARTDLYLRCVGTDRALPIEARPSLDALAQAFRARHQQAFGYMPEEAALEVSAVEVTLRKPSPHALPDPAGAGAGRAARTAPVSSTKICLPDGGLHEVPVHHEDALAPGHPADGPCVILSDTGTIVVAPDFRWEKHDSGAISLWPTRAAHAAAPKAHHEDADPVQLEIFHGRYEAIAEEMGAMLQRTARSANIRERLDFSCAIFDGAGGLVANAPHIPVHLGAMGATVRALLARHPAPPPGQSYISNAPHQGGSHLPDITVISPVHSPDGAQRFFVASRGHHADVGGTTPGSMPPASTTLAEEGVVFDLVPAFSDEGRLDRDGLRDGLLSGPHPARDPDTNLADLEAQLAANHHGKKALLALVEELGPALVEAYMGHVQQNAEDRVRDALRQRPDQSQSFEDITDEGDRIAVRVDLSGDRLRVDFRGTSPARAGNTNAPRAITESALLYVLRCLVDEAIPLNAGCLRPIDLHIPDGCLLAPEPHRAVCGGNVETSQRVVDVLLAALDRLAASQGTMNNLSLGNTRFAHYETIAGGVGAGPGGPGASAVHSHMTNTRITDPEILELRFPLRLRRFALRPASGGAGRFAGGDGIVRVIEATEALTASMLSDRRIHPPFGRHGGHAGQPGENLLNGRPMPGRFSVELKPGDRIEIRTPGGGGWGSPQAAVARTAPTTPEST